MVSTESSKRKASLCGRPDSEVKRRHSSFSSRVRGWVQTFESTMTHKSHERADALTALVKVLTRAEKREIVRLCTQHRGAYKGSADPTLSTGAISERCSQAWSFLSRTFGSDNSALGRVQVPVRTANLDPNMVKGLEHMFANHEAYLRAIVGVLPLRAVMSTQCETIPPKVAASVTTSARQAQPGHSSRHSQLYGSQTYGQADNRALPSSVHITEHVLCRCQSCACTPCLHADNMTLDFHNSDSLSDMIECALSESGELSIQSNRLCPCASKSSIPA